jgi:hypothetical protein
VPTLLYQLFPQFSFQDYTRVCQAKKTSAQNESVELKLSIRRTPLDFSHRGCETEIRLVGMESPKNCSLRADDSCCTYLAAGSRHTMDPP